MDGLARDLGDAPIDLLWITHPHSDHIGGAVDVLNHFSVKAYVDNGRDLEKATIAKTHAALDVLHVSRTLGALVDMPGSAIHRRHLRAAPAGATPFRRELSAIVR
jgi:glyoxylase-like metal-dependent hydrolase (beta-lactamase superfamily II)